MTTQLEFRVVGRSDEGGRFELPEGPFFIGSAEGCALRLPSHLVREKHASVRVDVDGSVQIEDVSGASLMWVDGQVVSRARLGPGALIRLGRAELELEVVGSEPTVRRNTPFRATGAPVQEPSVPLERTAISGRFTAGEIIENRYRIIGRLAAGGMGEVFRVEHIELGKQLALKMMLPGLNADQDFVNRFKIEAVAASRIGHPNIVDISDFGRTVDGRFFFVMEFLDGMTLSSLVHRNGAQAPVSVVHVGLQVARALAAAHELKIVHRDLKPDNVMVMQRPGNPDLVKVLDFGVARVQQNDESMSNTVAGMVVGTPQYMSPEQAKAIVVDARSDIYSLGLILHELLTGKPAFSGETPPIVMVKQVTEPPPPLGPGVPPALDALITRMLEKNPVDRPQRMGEVVDALVVLTAELPSGKSSTAKRAGVKPAARAPASSSRTPAPTKTPAAASVKPKVPTPLRGVVPSQEFESHATEAEILALAPSRTPMLLGVLGALLVIIAGGAWVLLKPSKPIEDVPVVPEVVEPTTPVEPLAVKPPEPTAPQEVSLRIVTVPEGVEISENGLMLGNAPLTLKRKPDTILELSLSLAGYRTEQRKLMVTAGTDTVSVTLEKVKGVVNVKRPTELKPKDPPPELNLKAAPF
jgi:serine/threonine-protein kinase